MPLVLGMNSGSSFDGIDTVLVDIGLGQDGHPTPPVFVAGRSMDWPDAVRARVLRAFADDMGVFELARLHYAAGAVYALAAQRLLDEQGVGPAEVEVIGVDGQTIYQEPPDRDGYGAVPEGDLVARWLDGPYPCGLQIGEPAIIAAHCQIPVVWNFRPSDHALGGTGAPLMQYLDFVAFRDIGPVLTLNIGGIANCQLACRDRSAMMAFDTGPGNVMIDHAMGALFGQPYDRDGATAARGQVRQDLLAELRRHPFFRRPPPRSAWRLDFGASYAEEVMARHADLRPEDLVATFTAFTAWAIGSSLQAHIPDLDRVRTLIASGGGVRNRTLLAMVARELPESMGLALSDAHGIPAQYKEAVKFATLAYATTHSLANNIPSASGAAGYAVLGKTVLPPRAARGVG